MDSFFALVENSALSEWIRGSESIFGFPTIITLHAIGLGFLAGGSAAIDLRILGVAPSMPLKAMRRFLPLLWVAFGVNAVSGTLMLIAYPTKALTNPLFYLKLCLIALGVGLVYRIGATVLLEQRPEPKAAGNHGKMLAVASLAVWLALIFAGRFLAYTHKWELLGVPAVM
jgi:hypothetical protein